VDDGTGIVEVKQWIDSESVNDQMDTDSNKSKLVENGYCRVWGRLKAFNNKKHVGAHVIRPITDYNEINYHLLEATAVHLFFTRGPPSAGQQGQGPTAASGANGTNGEQQYAGGGKALNNMSSIAKRIYKTLQDSQSNEGLHVQMIASMIGVDVNEVYKGAEDLMSSGQIFTTVDDNTWAVLEF